MKGLFTHLTKDPRHYQIVVLCSLLVYGVGWLDFEVDGGNAIAILASAFLTQYVCTRVWSVPRLDFRSAAITAISLCLLLRTNSPGAAMTAAVIAIASKFVIRAGGRHIFNPSNFGIVAMLVFTDRAWVSPGQWGNKAICAFFMACLGGLVVNRAARSDVTIAFMAMTAALTFGRSAWIGEPMAIAVHRLESGALLLFAFFMISDPKTIPDSRTGRIAFAALVAGGAWYVQFRLFRTNGLLWSLAACSPAVPLMRRLAHGVRRQWRARAEDIFFQKGQSDETFAHGLLRRCGYRLREQSPVRILRLLRGEGRYKTVQ